MPEYLDRLDTLQSLAITQAWNNIDASEMLALVSLMESGKTLAGLIDTARRVTKFLKNVKRLQLNEIYRYNLKRKPKWLQQKRNPRSKRSERAWNEIREEFTLNSLADRWMEIRYGWRPLYYEVIGAINALKAQFKHLRQTFRGKATDTLEAERVCSARHTLQSWGWVDYTAVQKASVSLTARAGVLTDVDLSKMDPWGFTKIPESALELHPYSFVLGWFFNTTEWLGSWTPDVGFTPLASWVTTEVVETHLSTITGVSPGHNSNTSTRRYDVSTSVFPGHSWFQVITRINRKPNPRRDLLPTFKLRLDAAKLLDLVIMGKNLLYGGRYPLANKNLRL